jgi:DNA-binding IclR family transcriptional regulator
VKREQLEKLLMTTTEDGPQVSGRLHQDIMRRVRQAEPVAGKASIDWRIPVYGTAMSLLVFYFLQSAAVHRMSPAGKAPPGNLLTETSLTTLKDQLDLLSKHTRLPEEELKAELNRLKSDLKRFDLRS